MHQKGKWGTTAQQRRVYKRYENLGYITRSPIKSAMQQRADPKVQVDASAQESTKTFTYSQETKDNIRKSEATTFK